MESDTRQTKLQYRIDIILTVLFLLTIFFFGIMTVATDGTGLFKAFSNTNNAKAQLKDPDHYSQWDLLAARITDLDSYIAQNIYGHTEMGYANSTLQYSLGKRLISTGSTTNMLKLNTGHLYDLQSRVSMDQAVSDVSDMKAIAGDIPFLFVYEHPTLYDDSQMPEGYDVLDHSAEMADEVTSRIRDAGIDVIDSRDVLKSSGLDISEYLMVTDQHWATRASLIMAQAITEHINPALGDVLDPSLLDYDQFNTETYEKLFLGKYGQRIGTGNVDPDDITIYWPKYETSITRHTVYLKNTYDESGAFRDSVIRWQYLQPDEGRTWNIKAYFDYGLTENYDVYTNENAPDRTILILKDSYSASIASFMSLTCRTLYAVDLRRSDLTLQEWIDEVKPDMVILAYSLQMMKQEEYEFQ